MTTPQAILLEAKAEYEGGTGDYSDEFILEVINELLASRKKIKDLEEKMKWRKFPESLPTLYPEPPVSHLSHPILFCTVEKQEGGKEKIQIHLGYYNVLENKFYEQEGDKKLEFCTTVQSFYEWPLMNVRAL